MPQAPHYSSLLPTPALCLPLKCLERPTERWCSQTLWWEGDICTQPSASTQHGQLTVPRSHVSAHAHFVHRVRGELQMASKNVLLLLTSPCAEVVILGPKDTREVCGDPDRTETLQTGTCFSGRRVCGFQRVFVQVTRPLARQARRCVQFSYVERDEHRVPQTWTHDASKRSKAQALGTPKTSRACGIAATAPGGRQGTSLWLGLHSGPSSEPGCFR